MVVEALTAEQRTPATVELAVHPPRLARPTGLLREIDGARRVDAYCAAFAPDQIFQRRTHGVFPLHDKVQVINNDAPRPVPRR